MTQPAAPPPAAGVAVYDPSSGQLLGQVAPDEAANLYRSGQATFGKDQQVPIQTPQGLKMVSGAEAAAYLESGESIEGGLASLGQYQQQEERKQYDSAGTATAAAGLGALRGVSFGLSDAAIAGVGGEGARTYLQKAQEYNPNASLVGEGVGILAPLALSGGSSGVGLLARGAKGAQGLATAARVAEGGAALAKGAETAGLLSRGLEAATALPRGVSALGSLAEQGAARALGESALARAASSAAGAAVEGSLYGVGNAVSQSAIQNTDLTAEQVLAAAGHGALIGGALGGGVSLLGSALRAGGEKAGALLADLGKTESRVAGELEGALPKTEGGWRALVDDVGKEHALKATGANQGMIERLAKMGEGIENRAVKQLLEDVPRELGKKEGALLSAAEKAEGAAKLLDRIGKAKGALVDELETAGVKADVPEMVSNLRGKLLDKASSILTTERNAASAGEDIIARIEQKFGESGDIRGLFSAQRDIGKRIDWNAIRKGSASDSAKVEADIYFALGKELERVGEKAEQLGPEFIAKWKNTNAEYQAASWLKGATEKGEAAATRNRAGGLSERFGEVQGIALAAASGLSGPGAMAAAVAGHMAQNLARKYGSDVIANLARATTKGELLHSISTAVDGAMGERVAGLFKGTAEKVKQGRFAAPIATEIDRALERSEAKSRKPIQTQFSDEKARLASFTAAPQPRLDAVAKGLDGADPKVISAVQQKTMQAAQFLESKLPKRAAPQTITPQFDKAQPSPAEMAEWLRYAKAVNDPLSVIEDAKHGKVTREGAEALRTVYPEMYRKLQEQTWSQVAELKKPLSYAQKVQLNILLDLPTDPSLDPQNIARQQQAYQQAAPAPGGKPQGGPGTPQATPPPRPVNIAGSLATKSSTLEKGPS